MITDAQINDEIRHLMLCFKVYRTSPGERCPEDNFRTQLQLSFSRLRGKEKVKLSALEKVEKEIISLGKGDAKKIIERRFGL